MFICAIISLTETISYQVIQPFSFLNTNSKPRAFPVKLTNLHSITQISGIHTYLTLKQTLKQSTCLVIFFLVLVANPFLFSHKFININYFYLVIFILLYLSHIPPHCNLYNIIKTYIFWTPLSFPLQYSFPPFNHELCSVHVPSKGLNQSI